MPAPQSASALQLFGAQALTTTGADASGLGQLVLGGQLGSGTATVVPLQAKPCGQSESDAQVCARATPAAPRMDMVTAARSEFLNDMVVSPFRMLLELAGAMPRGAGRGIGGNPRSPRRLAAAAPSGFRDQTGLGAPISRGRVR